MANANLKLLPPVVALPEVVVNDLEAGLTALTDWMDILLRSEMPPMLKMQGNAARAEIARLQRVLLDTLK
jgi:hypothetical protein